MCHPTPNIEVAAGIESNGVGLEGEDGRRVNLQLVAKAEFSITVTSPMRKPDDHW
jgi:hypothetical protein